MMMEKKAPSTLKLVALHLVRHLFLCEFETPRRLRPVIRTNTRASQKLSRMRYLCQTH
jgi:hypothetical protein